MKKQIRYALISLLVISTLICSAALINAEEITEEVAFSGITEESYFTAVPGVYEMGDGYAVIWATSFDGIGYITYNYNGVEYTVYDEIDGILKTDESIHVVKVPYEHLTDNEYTVYSKEVISHIGDSIQYGDAISAGPIRLRGYDGDGEVDIIVLTDVHLNLDRAEAALSHVSEKPDLFAFLGDIIEFSSQMSHLHELFNIMGTVSGGQYPVLFARGNHEAMGEYAPLLKDYFPTETEGMYYDFRFGPLYGVVVDTGADHDDDADNYSDTVCYEDYSLTEEQWLRGLEADTEAKYRLALNHIPWLHDLPNGIDMTDSMGHLGLQLGISGHEHRVEYLPVGTYEGLEYPAYICGGKTGEGYVAMLLTLEGDEARIKAIDMEGNTVHENTVALESFYGERAPVEEIERGLNGKVRLRSSHYVSITAGPVVIDSGDSFYTVVWTTDKIASGAVEYSYNGKDYQVFEDQIGGRIFDTVHAVQVPKEHLLGNSYCVLSFNMEKFYPYGPVRGKGVKSDIIEFADMSADQPVTAAIVTEVDYETDGEKVYGACIMGGEYTDSIDTEEDIFAIIHGAWELTGGRIPVSVSRDSDGYGGQYGAKLVGYIGSGGFLQTEAGEATLTFNSGERIVFLTDDEEDDGTDRLELARRMFFIASRIRRKY